MPLVRDIHDVLVHKLWDVMRQNVTATPSNVSQGAT